MDKSRREINTEELKARIDVAAGREPADLVICNCRIANVFTNEILRGEIAIVNGYIAALGTSGSYHGASRIDAGGRIAVPGLIDAHMHLESTMVRPSQFSLAAVPRGTLGVIADPHEIANVCGVAGIDFILEDSSGIPMDVWVMIPSCVPATAFETSGASLDADDIGRLMDNPRVRGLGEMMNYPGVIAADPQVLDKIGTIQREAGQIADGHSPRVCGRDLNAYVAAGIQTDHECATVQEMTDRLRLGMYVQMREGSACRNLATLLEGVTEANARRLLLCTDDKHPEDILRDGHIDNSVRKAIRFGIDPLVVLRMATLNVAECYNLEAVGAIAPGYRADLLLLDSLEDFSIHQVYRRGNLVAEDGKALFEVQDFVDTRVYGSVNIRPLRKDALVIRLSGTKARVIGLRPHSVETDTLIEEVRVDGGSFAFDPTLGILKLAVVERHHASGNVGVSLVKGYGLHGGAIASSIGHDSHNLVVIGDNDEDMLAAIAELERVQGGITVVTGGKIADTLPLPIAGLMSDKPLHEVAEAVSRMQQRAYALGVSPEIEPFMTLSFLALPVIPALKLTDQGLFDVEQFSFVSVDACT